jgi:hypothetical protein
MLNFKLELLNDESVDSFSLGHITIAGRSGAITSKGKVPDQAMMIFISITELLCGIRQFICDEKLKEYNFVGADSSFQFYIKKKEKTLIITNNCSNKIDSVTYSELSLSVWEGVNDLLSKYGHYITPEELIYDDLCYSTEEFKRILDLFTKH